MAKKPCAEPGCPRLVHTTRCPTHTRARDKARGTRQQRGYDNDHDKLRATYVAQLRAGHTLTCWRCTGDITTEADLHVGHDDHDRSITRGPEHRLCNLRAAGHGRTQTPP